MRRGRTAAAAGVMGAIAFMNVARNPRFEMFHTVDVLGLFVSGVCIGVALAASIGRLKARGEV